LSLTLKERDQQIIDLVSALAHLTDEVKRERDYAGDFEDEKVAALEKVKQLEQKMSDLTREFQRSKKDVDVLKS